MFGVVRHGPHLSIALATCWPIGGTDAARFATS